MIAGLVKTSLVDYPAKVATTIFTQGCNLNCIYCHNKILIPKVKGVYQNEEIIKLIKERFETGKIDGVCITGGEPTIHKLKLINFIKQIKKEIDIPVKLDTNGTNPEVLELLIPYIDFLALDYKTDNYKKNLHIMDKNINKSLNIVKANFKHNHQIRFTNYEPYWSDGINSYTEFLRKNGFNVILQECIIGS